MGSCHGASLLLATLLLGACDVAVQTGVSADDADRTVAVLRSLNIGASTRPEPGGPHGPRVSVLVPPDEVADAVQALTTSHTRTWPEQVAAISETPLVTTPDQERVRLAAVTAREIERTLRLWDGVLDARVHVVPTGRVGLLGSAPTHARAAIVVRYLTGHDPSLHAIRALATGAISGLDEDKVSVVLLPTKAPTPARLVTVGGLSVSRGSAVRLKLLLAGALLSLSTLAAALLWKWRSERRARATVTLV